MKKILAFALLLTAFAACKKETVTPAAPEISKVLTIYPEGAPGTPFEFRIYKVYERSALDTLRPSFIRVAGVVDPANPYVKIQIHGPEFYYAVAYRILNSYPDSVAYSNANGSGWNYYTVDHAVEYVNRTQEVGMAIPALIY